MNSKIKMLYTAIIWNTLLQSTQQINISDLSCSAPYTAHEDTHVIVNQDFYISGICKLIAVAQGTSPTIEFYSATPRTITITSGNTWDLTSCNNATIKLCGYTTLQFEQGAILKGNGVSIIVSNYSQITGTTTQYAP